MQNMQLGQAGFEPMTFGIKDSTLPTLPTVPDILTSDILTPKHHGMMDI